MERRYNKKDLQRTVETVARIQNEFPYLKEDVLKTLKEYNVDEPTAINILGLYQKSPEYNNLWKKLKLKEKRFGDCYSDQDIQNMLEQVRTEESLAKEGPRRLVTNSSRQKRAPYILPCA